MERVIYCGGDSYLLRCRQLFTAVETVIYCGGDIYLAVYCGGYSYLAAYCGGDSYLCCLLWWGHIFS